MNEDGISESALDPLDLWGNLLRALRADDWIEDPDEWYSREVARMAERAPA